MPAVETRPPPQEGDQARDDETAELPSFYSPQSRALNHSSHADGQRPGREGDADEAQRTSQLNHFSKNWGSDNVNYTYAAS